MNYINPVFDHGKNMFSIKDMNTIFSMRYNAICKIVA